MTSDSKNGIKNKDLESLLLLEHCKILVSANTGTKPSHCYQACWWQ